MDTLDLIYAKKFAGSGGGGGSSDFSTAEVTIINTDTSEGVVGGGPVIIDQSIEIDINIGPQETTTYTVVLYNGTSHITFWNGFVIERDGAEVFPHEDFVNITGDTTLKVEWSD